MHTAYIDHAQVFALRPRAFLPFPWSNRARMLLPAHIDDSTWLAKAITPSLLHRPVPLENPMPNTGAPTTTTIKKIPQTTTRVIYFLLLLIPLFSYLYSSVAA